MSWPLAGTTTIGREGDIQLDDPYLSRRQASVRSRGGRVRVRSQSTSNPTLVAFGPWQVRVPGRWIPVPSWCQLIMGSGTFRIQRTAGSTERRGSESGRRPGGWRPGGKWRPGGGILRLVLPLAMGAAMIPFAMNGPPWRWLLVLVPALGAFALLGQIGSGRRGARGGGMFGARIHGPRRSELPHLIAAACQEGRAFHTVPVLPRKPRALHSGDLAGTGWYLTSAEEACWLAGFLAAYNDPDVIAVQSPWLETRGEGLTVRFEEDARQGPGTAQALFTWGRQQPSWALALHLPRHARASAAWAQTLQPPTPDHLIPASVAAHSAIQEARAARSPRAHLLATLGQSEQGQVQIDLATHGPHALVAGTTGAGKSELLTTWLLTLAARNSPETLALVLVDFKGGAAFAPLAALPHTAALLTDLDPGATRRALASMRALLRQRERLLHQAGARDITDLERHDPASATRLLVVVDEFRALATDHPDLMDQLLRLAAQGRSLGVHLIVATQRPAGAIGPELRANMPLRICLRVAEPADSQDVLNSPLAARLPRIPGRALLSDGASPTPFQVAYSGDPAQVRATVAALRKDWPRPGQQLPWCPPLPPHLATTDLPPGCPALADHPEELAQPPLPLGVGHVLVAGPPRSGRSTAAKAIALAAHDLGEEVWLVTADRTTGSGNGRIIAVHQTRLVAGLLEHLESAPNRCGVLDDVELWLAAHDALHGGGTGSALLTQAVRSIAAAGSRLVVVGGSELPTARWAAACAQRFLLAGTDHTAALLAGLPRAAAEALAQAPPGRAHLLGANVEVQFAMAASLASLTNAAPATARLFLPLPPPAPFRPEPGRLILGVGGDPPRTVSLGVDGSVVVVGKGEERDAAVHLIESQHAGTVLAVTPTGWATGWGGELGRVRDSAAVLVVRPDLVGMPPGLAGPGALEPGGPGYAVLVEGARACALRLATYPASGPAPAGGPP